jgi:hypothetical protein
MQFDITIGGAKCAISLADMPDGVSWRARIVRNGSVTRDVTAFVPGPRLSTEETKARVEWEVRAAIEWLEGQRPITSRP